MNTHGGGYSENRNPPIGLTGQTGPTNGSGFTSLAGRSRLVPTYVVWTAAMILLCRPLGAAAADEEGKSTHNVVTDKVAGAVQVPLGQTAPSGIPQTQSFTSPGKPPALPSDSQDSSSSAGRSNTCPGTDLGVLSSLGGVWTGSTTDSTDDFDAPAGGCGTSPGGQDEIFRFNVEVDGIWRFDTCSVAAGWDTSLALRKDFGGGCPGIQIACDENGCNVGNGESSRTGFLAADSTYYLVVDGRRSTAFGDFTVTYEYLGPVPDSCPGTDVGELSSGGGSWVGSTEGSTDDFDDRFNPCMTHIGGPDEIFKFTVDVAGTWRFDTCTVQSCWDTVLSLRRETRGGCPGDFVACDNDGCETSCAYQSAIESFVERHTVYYLIVDGLGPSEFGEFKITYDNISGGCTVDAHCDDGVFCNGAEFCDIPSLSCRTGEPPCDPPADCDEEKATCQISPCITWRAGRGSDLFLPQIAFCPNTKTWIFDDIQASHHATDVLDWYTTPLVSSEREPEASPHGTTFFVDQAIWTVESGSCNPLAIVPGTECEQSGVVGEEGVDGPDVDEFRCSGTMPTLPNNSGDFDRCEVDFFIAFRTAENGAGMWIAGEEESIGGPGAADDFGGNRIWVEDCPPTGVFEPVFFKFKEGEDYFEDFATAEVCQKTEAHCDMKNVTGVVFGDSDSVGRLGFDPPGNCAIDAREPHSINDPFDRKGWDRMVISFDCDPTSLGLSTEDFTFFTAPPVFTLISIGSVTADAVEKTVTVTLTGRIPPGVWTCISFPETGARWCMGFLPADASQDGLSAAGDINALINSINLVPGLVLPPHATDINRSGVTTGTDILRLIDLLNGAGSFSIWITAALPPCPSE